jgi:hypothetical protein
MMAGFLRAVAPSLLALLNLGEGQDPAALIRSLS